ncbi:MAG: ORF6C domain-containing protein [Verrucomicrobiae bacterium]
MPAKKLDYIISCDQWDMEKAEASVYDWIDANGKNVELRPYDSAEHDQFAVEMARATNQADRVVLFLTNRYVPLSFTVPVFQAAISSDPQCSGKKVFAVAFEELERTEVVSVMNMMDAFSGNDRERRRRFVEQVIQSKPKAKKRLKADEPPSGVSISQKVGKAQNVIAAAGNVNIATKHVTRTEFTPDERHLSPEQSAKIQALVKELAEMDVAAGKSEARSFQTWWSYLKNTFKVTTYKEIPRERFDEAVSLLQQAKARNLPAIRRKDNELWRRKLYASIFAIAKKNLGWSDEDIHAFASLKLGKAVSSLKDVGERDLTKIVRLIRAEARKK